MAKQIFRGYDHNGQPITEVKSVQILEDAASPDQAVRKSQSETIADAAVQDKLVSSHAQSSSDTAFTSQYMVSALSGKQNNMSIHPDSTAFAELVDGNKIRITSLTTNETVVDSVYPSLQDLLDCPDTTHSGSGYVIYGVPIERGDLVQLTNPAVPAQSRTFIHSGGSVGDASDFLPLTQPYDTLAIRSMFAGSQYLDYDAAAGVYSIDLGTGAGELGAQSLPESDSAYQVIAGFSDVHGALVALEALAVNIESTGANGTAVVNTRLDNLSGVAGANLGSFVYGLFDPDKSIKEVLAQSESLHRSSGIDRGAIRSEVAVAVAALEQADTNEASTRSLADVALNSRVDVEAASRTSADAALQASLNAQIIANSSDHAAIDSRLDVIEGSSSTVGSVAKAQADATASAAAYTDQEVSQLRTDHDLDISTLSQQVTDLQQGDIKLIGTLNADGSVSVSSERINAGDNRNGQQLSAIALVAGETFIVGADMTLAYGGGGSASYLQGDKILVMNSGDGSSLVESDVTVAPANGTALATINVGTATVDFDGSSKLEVVDDSIGRQQLASDVEADIDDRRSLTTSNAITSPSDTHFVVDVGTSGGQNTYDKRTYSNTDAATDTQRVKLVELFTSSAGSGNAAAPSYAHANTNATFYNGTCVDFSMAIGGGNFEANVTNPNAAVYATGGYFTARSPQLGINSAVTGVAQNAGTSNIGITGFSRAGGAGNDRGGVFAISDLEFLAYAGFRAYNPLPHPDAALVADAGTATNAKAFYAAGDSIFDGAVDIPVGTEDSHAMNLQNLKNTQEIWDFDLTDNVPKTIPTNLDFEKCMVRTIHETTDIEVAVSLVGGELQVLAKGGSLTGVRLLLQELSCSVESV